MKKVINLLFTCCIFVGAFGCIGQVKLIDPDESPHDMPVLNPTTNPILPAQSALLLIIYPYLNPGDKLPDGIPNPLKPHEIDIKTEPHNYYFQVCLTLSEEQNSQEVLAKCHRIIKKIGDMAKGSKENFGPIEVLFRQCNYNIQDSTGRKAEYNTQKAAEYERRLNTLEARIKNWLSRKSPAGLGFYSITTERIRR